LIAVLIRPGAIAYAVGLLGAIFTYAMRQGIRIDSRVHSVVKFATGRRERRLTDGEFQMLGIALSKADQAAVWKSAIAATRLMALAGWRRGGVWSGWSEVDLPRRPHDWPTPRPAYRCDRCPVQPAR
jgi:hypothetical protein